MHDLRVLSAIDDDMHSAHHAGSTYLKMDMKFFAYENFTIADVSFFQFRLREKLNENEFWFIQYARARVSSLRLPQRVNLMWKCKQNDVVPHIWSDFQWSGLKWNKRKVFFFSSRSRRKFGCNCLLNVHVQYVSKTFVVVFSCANCLIIIMQTHICKLIYAHECDAIHDEHNVLALCSFQMRTTYVSLSAPSFVSIAI